MNNTDSQEQPPINDDLLAAHKLQRDDYLKHPIPNYTQRKQDLKQLKAIINDNRDAIIEAISQDYGNRSRHETLFAEIISVTDGINDTISNLRSWMKPQKRHVDQTMFLGGKSRVVPQPLGVAGLIVPWNFPINLSFSQLCATFAAGNRAMVKMSENSINLTKLLIRIVGDYFPPEKLQFFEETGIIGRQFSQIPFDLIIFTGSGPTGSNVMASAAKNLTPVILELGGKAPAIIDPKYSIDKAVERIMFVKQFNAGQICTNVDYVFVHKSQVDTFVEKAKKYTLTHCPDIEHVDYTAIIDQRSVKRLEETLDDAREQGATVINMSNDQSINHESRKFPLHIVTNTTEDMRIRQRETFGPILMVMPYDNAQEVVDYVNANDRPLALYPFTNNKKLAQYYIDHIMSGGVTVNDALFHVAQHDLPFGGVGPSGMGHYHGFEGFVSCSKMRPIFYQASVTSMKMLAPPYGAFADKVYNMLAKLKS